MLQLKCNAQLFVYWVILHAFLLSADFSELDFFFKDLSEKTSLCQNSLDPDHARYFVLSELSPICLQKLTTGNKNRH